MEGKGKLTFIPYGGLANRMRAIASAVNLAQRTGVELSITWFREWAMEARYDELFKPFSIEGVTLYDASWWEYYVYDRPRRKNMWLPSLAQKMMFDGVMNEQEAMSTSAEDTRLESWAMGRKTIMPNCMKFGVFEDYDGLVRRLFTPLDEISGDIRQHTERFSSHTIGIHIRRTDNAKSIASSPLEAFTKAIDKEVAENPDTSIFLATDDEPTRRELLTRYGNRVLTSAHPATRANAEGVRNGLVDMFTLAATKRIYGSIGSSFSVMASSIGGIEAEMVNG